MKTTNLSHPVFSFIIDNLKEVETIKLEYGDTVPDTIQDRLQWTFDTFKREYVNEYNVRRYETIQNVFSQWLMGVPSAIHIPVYYGEIIELAKQWGIIPQNATERQEQKICDNWYNFMSMKFFQLCKKYKVNTKI